MVFFNFFPHKSSLAFWYTNYMLTKEDKKDIGGLIRDNVLEVLEQVVFPRFDKLDGDVAGLKLTFQD